MPTEQDYAPTWPGVKGEEQQPGMKIVGTLTGGTIRKRKMNGKEFPVLYLDVDGVETHVPAWHTMLDQLLEEVKPQIGSTVEIVFEGEKDLGDGRNPMKLYRVNGQGDSGDHGGGRLPSWLQVPASQAAPQQAPQQVQEADDDDDSDIPF